METLAKSDAFFFISSIAIVLITIMALIILFYGIRLFRTAVGISKKIKEESDNISNDIAAMRAKVSEQGLGIKTLFSIASAFFSNTMGKTARKNGGKKSRKAKSGLRSGSESDEE